MKNSFIPINENNINKIQAFFPSTDVNWRKGQKMYGKKVPVETMNVVEELFDNGWSIDGGYEEKNNKSGLVEKVMLKFRHNDLAQGSLNKMNEVLPTFNIVNNFKGYAPSFNFGTYRMICSNGMWGTVGEVHHFNIKSNEQIHSGISEVNEIAAKQTNELYKFKGVDLEEAEIVEFAQESMKLRFDSTVRHAIDYRQILESRRNEDLGNSLWSVFNRIQENTSKRGLIKTDSGVLVNQLDPIADMNYNTKLIDLAGNYYN